MKYLSKIQKYIICLFIATSFFSCSEEETDNTEPIIVVQKPEVNSSYFVSSPIAIKFDASDETKLESVSIVLTNGSVQKSLAMSFSLNTNEVSIDTNYWLSDTLIDGGNYIIEISAFDGTNRTKKHINVEILGYEREFERFIIVEQKNANTLQISSFNKDSICGFNKDNIYENILETQGDFTDSEFSYKQNLLFLAGRQTLNLKTFDLSSKTMVWKETSSYPTPYHNNLCLHFDGNKLLTTFNNGDFKLYKTNGIVEINNSVGKFSKAYYCFHYKDKFYIDVKENNLQGHSMGVFYDVSGESQNLLYTNLEVIEIMPKSVNEFFVIGNEDGNGVIRVYNSISGNLTYRKELIGTTFVAAIDPKNMFHDIIICSENSLYSFTYQADALTKIKGNFYAKSFKFEELEAVIYYCYDNTIYSLNSNYETENTYTLPLPILDFHFDYNK